MHSFQGDKVGQGSALGMVSLQPILKAYDERLCKKKSECQPRIRHHIFLSVAQWPFENLCIVQRRLSD